MAPVCHAAVLCALARAHAAVVLAYASRRSTRLYCKQDATIAWGRSRTSTNTDGWLCCDSVLLLQTSAEQEESRRRLPVLSEQHRAFLPPPPPQQLHSYDSTLQQEPAAALCYHYCFTNATLAEA